MRTLVRPLLLVAAAALAPACKSTPEPSGGVPVDPPARGTIVEHVDREAAKQLVAGGAVIVDVSTPDQFGSGHLEGARNVPLEELAARMSEIEKSRTVIVTARDGQRAARGARLLAEHGFQVKDLGVMDASD